MALHRGSSNRFSATIWPGFVDAMTALLMVLMFVLTIFMVVQSVLRDQITIQGSTIDDQMQTISQQQGRLDDLGRQVASIGAALTTSQDRQRALSQQSDEQATRADQAEAALATAEAQARDRAARITRLTNQLDAGRSDLDTAQSRLTDFEAQVAALLAARAENQAARQQLQDQVTTQQSRADAAELAVAAARTETDARTTEARLAAARRDALQALTDDLRTRAAEAEMQVTAASSRRDAIATKLTQAEQARLTEAEAARLLRERLAGADAELTAMTLSLEESRRKAQDTLTLLAGAEAARDRLGERVQDGEKETAALAQARTELARQTTLTQDGQRRVALLNEQVAELTGQLANLRAILDASGTAQDRAELRVADLGQQLNAALLRAAEEKDRRLTLEQQARQTAEAEARDLSRYRSEFFGRLSQILSGRKGVQVVGDRFVFQSEVLFAPGEATLSPQGREQIAGVARMLSDVAGQIPPEIDWIIRVDGHTDSQPLSGAGRYRDNWELSQGRALAVVRYMIDDLGFPANRLAAAGFADTRPVTDGRTPEALAQNRRIELKLTER